MLVYFVSYHFKTQGGNDGFGRTEMRRPSDILSIEDIEKVEKAIKDLNDFSEVVIISFQLLYEDRVSWLFGK